MLSDLNSALKGEFTVVKPIRAVFALAMSVCLILSGCGGNNNAVKEIKTQELEKAGEVIPSEDEYRLCAQNDRLSLYVNGYSGSFYAEDKLTGELWYSNPQIVDESLTGIKKTNMKSQLLLSTVGADESEQVTNSYVECVKNDTVKVCSLENGFRAVFDFQDLEITVSVDVVLDGNDINVSVPKKGIEEKGQNHIYSLAPYPYFGVASGGENGYIVVPDGSGALIDFNNGKASLSMYKQRIYGADVANVIKQVSNYTEQAYLPVFGIKNGGGAFVCILENGAEYAYCNAFTAGQYGNYNGAYFSFELRYSYDYEADNAVLVAYDHNPLLCGDINLKYCLLDQNTSDYSGMAARVRKYLIDNYNMKQTASPLGLALKVVGSTTQKKYVMGVETHKNVALTDYKNLSYILDECKDKGIDSVNVLYVKSTSDAAEQKISGAVKPVSLLGGKAEFKKLNTKDNSTVAHLVNTAVFSKGGNGASKYSTSIRDMRNGLIRYYPYKLSTYYPDKKVPLSYYATPKAWSKIASDIVSGTKDASELVVGANELSTVLYSDYRKNNRVGRTQAIVQAVDGLKAMSKGFKGVVSEGANFYSLPYLKYVFSAPQEDSRFNITDRSIPFYELVMSGFVGYSTSSLNLSENPQDVFLKALETGSALQYTVYGSTKVEISETDSSELFSCCYDNVKDDIWGVYSKYKQAREKVSGYPTAHRYLAENVTETTYSDGGKIIVNKGSKDYTTDFGETVGSMNYLVLEDAR